MAFINNYYPNWVIVSVMQRLKFCWKVGALEAARARQYGKQLTPRYICSSFAESVVAILAVCNSCMHATQDNHSRLPTAVCFPEAAQNKHLQQFCIIELECKANSDPALVQPFRPSCPYLINHACTI
jgi:hypothetical protein